MSKMFTNLNDQHLLKHILHSLKPRTPTHKDKRVPLVQLTHSALLPLPLARRPPSLLSQRNLPISPCHTLPITLLSWTPLYRTPRPLVIRRREIWKKDWCLLALRKGRTRIRRLDCNLKLLLTLILLTTTGTR